MSCLQNVIGKIRSLQLPMVIDAVSIECFCFTYNVVFLG